MVGSIEKVIVTDKFERDIKKLRDKRLSRRIDLEAKRLFESPDAGKPLRYGLKGERTVRIGMYRLIYKREGADLLLLRFEHRKDVYD
ncbi:MAG: type II toxin-antitoxin system RelE/ParE family toxin [Candidatus Micrarchaeota archaeon]|nr:type II toxin-antitoxin system RelE/ParE family toxin [Candidatus Micrarchaeota archaeon]MDE1848010.1 type II toxin-antitoxin system RelE/ParE family toxin [Candidatus Micrarchaeota archaeon]MDE1864613.1 type II toxin-antitoxin system RelE/ParE family toxin [Candidatus Micrarchaeota archaeon]